MTDFRLGTTRNYGIAQPTFAYWPIVLSNSVFLGSTGPRVANLPPRAGQPGISLGWAGECHSWRRAPEEFGNSPQVLRRCSEQDLVPGTV